MIIRERALRKPFRALTRWRPMIRRRLSRAFSRVSGRTGSLSCSSDSGAWGSSEFLAFGYRWRRDGCAQDHVFAAAGDQCVWTEVYASVSRSFAGVKIEPSGTWGGLRRLSNGPTTLPATKPTAAALAMPMGTALNSWRLVIRPRLLGLSSIVAFSLRWAYVVVAFGAVPIIAGISQMD